MLDNELNNNEQNKPQKENIFLSIYRNYFCFDGRLNRKPFILRSLAITIIPILLMVLLFYLFAGGLPPKGEYLHKELFWVHVMLHLGLMFLPIVSGFSLGIRRCHDLNLSGWWLILGLLPYISIVWGFYLMLKKGTDGKNDYGEDLLKRSEVNVEAS